MPPWCPALSLVSLGKRPHVTGTLAWEAVTRPAAVCRVCQHKRCNPLLLLGLFAWEVREEAKVVPRHGIGDRAPPDNHSATGGGCGGAIQGQGLRARSGPSPSRPAVSRWRTTKDHRWGDRADDHPATRANLRNIIVTWQQDFSFGARTDLIGSGRPPAGRSALVRHHPGNWPARLA